MSDDLTARLPPPHDEEPASLRSDIVDELRDHLVCASDRERRRLEISGHVADSQHVKQAVVERFGDPASVARRLWFDAMKGPIMVQRVFLAAVVLGLLVVIGWMVILSRTLSSISQENRQATAAILDRLAKERPSEFVPARVTLAYPGRGGPVVNQPVLLEGMHGKAEGSGEYIQKTNQQGVADFGSLPWGVYRLTIHTDVATLRDDKAALQVNTAFQPRITVPLQPGTRPVRFQFQVPDWTDWKWKTDAEGVPGPQAPGSDQAYLVVRYQVIQNMLIDGNQWQSDHPVQLVVLHDGRVFPHVQEDEFEFKLSLDLKDPVESILVPEGQLYVTAEWYMPDPNAPEPSPRRLVPIQRYLEEEFMQSATRGADRKTFPLRIPISPGHEIQNVAIPGEHSGTFDGIEIPPLFPPVRGGGGGIF